MTLIHRKFTVADYHKMIAVGILHEDERVELIHGEMICMSPKGSKHAGYTTRLTKALKELEETYILRFQDPTTLDNHSEPEPDIAVVYPRTDDYVSAHPGPDEVLLLIEIADSSLSYDRTIKVPLYASAGIPELWIVNVAGEAIEVYLNPIEDQYESVHIFKSGGHIPIPGSSETMSVDMIFD
ncbi:MAG: Uma2 family endonuclease [Bacteroidota bacterium]